MCVGICLHACLCTTCMSAAPRLEEGQIPWNRWLWAATCSSGRTATEPSLQPPKSDSLVKRSPVISLLTALSPCNFRGLWNERPSIVRHWWSGLTVTEKVKTLDLRLSMYARLVSLLLSVCLGLIKRAMAKFLHTQSPMSHTQSCAHTHTYH